MFAALSGVFVVDDLIAFCNIAATNYTENLAIFKKNKKSKHKVEFCKALMKLLILVLILTLKS